MVLALGLTAASCGSDPVSSPPPSTTGTTAGTQPPSTAAPTSTTSTTAPPTTDEAEVRAVIDRFWPAYLAATMGPDPNNTELVDVLGGEARTRIIDAIAALERDGHRVVQPADSVFAHRITSVTFPEQDQAVVIECVVDDLQIVDTSNGAIVNGDVSTSAYTTYLRREDGLWRMTFSEQSVELDGVHDCSAVT